MMKYETDIFTKLFALNWAGLVLLAGYRLNHCFFKENVGYAVWICRDPISLTLGPDFL